MTEFSKALVERVALVLMRRFWPNSKWAELTLDEQSSLLADATAALTASGLDEAIEALNGLLGGKCPQCDGWGEVAYFGEMVDCRCAGKYRHQPTDEAIARARTLTDKLKG